MSIINKKRCIEPRPKENVQKLMFVVVGEKLCVFFFYLCNIMGINFPFSWLICTGRIFIEEYVNIFLCICLYVYMCVYTHTLVYIYYTCIRFLYEILIT